ncbi:MAG: RNA polymerase subunit sigma-24 [Proteobacteria bacterium]|nr:MAG: RNA polymerase subunit sigma-24 [Pseudomonadota bacterium]
MRELSDRDAVARAREGDQEAFRVLVERYQGRIHRLAQRVLRDDEQARDTVQDAFLKAYTNLGGFEGRSSFYTWLYRLAMNLCLDARRRDRSDRFVATPEPGDLERIATLDARPAGEQHWRSHEESPDDAVGRGELREAVARAIAALPDAARETLILREVEGLSYSEIAEALDIPKGTVMSRLHYARRRVQEILRGAGAIQDWDVETGEDSGSNPDASRRRHDSPSASSPPDSSPPDSGWLPSGGKR